MERLSDHKFELVDCERVALVCIQGTEQYQVALRQAAGRIRYNVRSSDIVLLPGGSCAIVLPDTPLEGAQAVVRRITPLLADIEYELQILCGSAAYALLQHLRTEQAVTIEQREREPVYAASLATQAAALPMTGRELDSLPYLAFLAHYPSQRLLHLFPYELACRYHCIPVGAERGILTLATSQELGREVIAYFQEVIQRNIFQVRCEASMVDDVLNYWQRTILV
ncbi:MAG TPA: hypothetical protein VFU49_08575 [Ktedonobacteraceae bacterium]|nr:hypothetical protein [Ktedonobacteraceae bacterium]